jgi:hypothetical protein
MGAVIDGRGNRQLKRMWNKTGTLCHERQRPSCVKVAVFLLSFLSIPQTVEHILWSIL